MFVPCGQCKLCGRHKGVTYSPNSSASSRGISCKSKACQCGGKTPCGCQEGQCTFSRHYAEKSSAKGFLKQDKVVFTPSLPAADIRFGCVTEESGAIRAQLPDGVMGLGSEEISVHNQLVAQGIIDDVFSICMGSFRGGGALVLGHVEVDPSVRRRTIFAHLLSQRRGRQIHYEMELKAVKIGERQVNFPRRQHGATMGAIVDTGTTFTYLPAAQFNDFKTKLLAQLPPHIERNVVGPDPRFQDVCFGNAEFAKMEQDFPAMTLQLRGVKQRTVEIELSPQNYLFLHTRRANAFCLGMFNNGNQRPLLGAITFRQVLIQFDKKRKQVGLVRTNCARVGSIFSSGLGGTDGARDPAARKVHAEGGEKGAPG